MLEHGMNRRRFLFTALTSPGHLFPAIVIARRLQSMGHEVAFATSPALDSFLREAGLAATRAVTVERDPFIVAGWWQIPGIVGQVAVLEPIVEAFEPDVLVGGALTMGPMILARHYRLPIGLVGFGAWLLPLDGEEGQRDAGETERARWRESEMEGYLIEAHRALGLPIPEDAAALLRGDLFLLRTIAELEPGHELLPSGVRLVGECTWNAGGSEEGAEVASWLHAAKTRGDRVVYLECSRSFQEPPPWPILAEAFADGGWALAASTGRSDVPVAGPPPGALLMPHLPHDLILPHAVAVISGGHTAAYLAALHHRVPHLLIGFGSGSEEFAARIVRAGVGIARPLAGLTVPSVRADLARLLSDRALHERVATLGGLLAATDGPGIAAEGLIELAARRASHPAAG